ncbi:MAG: hypothetical protein AB1679_19165 [Actinomycetota bacterium]
MTTITLVGARGGQGTSTVAAALALHAADDLPTVLLTHDPTAMARLLGTTGAIPAPPEPFAVGPTLTVASLDGPKQTVTIIDAGHAEQAAARLPVDGRRYAVVRGPCYLALATLVSHPDLRPDGVILVAEPGRALSAADTSAVLGVPVVATVPVRPSIARLIDAGLLAGRPDEIPGLDLLSHSLVHGVDPTPATASHPIHRAQPGIARHGADRSITHSWGHER